ncbi:MAG: CPBP family intramembrane metalloprotease [Rhodoferax sp.]|uniref:CPBP family intramembrane glutamic endopeptidase n=1 Tax=Rhodoferax sp. TaxID=50421 RepID=UPI0027354D9D|nr:CPBP family intramembrane glutamic endopeptidase [Rhodoferax sp.]MDP2678812.1 CPBP family intramembrane metalloprotease [Rhodoferax sp.]
MIHTDKSAWLTILVVEFIFAVVTHAVLVRYWTYSLDAELIRTPLRLAVVLIYWWLLRDFIRSQPIESSTLLHPSLLFPLLLFLSVPLLVGDLSYMTPATRVVYALTSIAVALREEIAFRALIQNLLAKRFGSPAAIILTTLAFTAFHIGAIPLSWFAYGQVAIASVLLGVVFARTQNLWLVVCLHTLYDALWSATPVLSPPFPYSVGLVVLSVALCGILWWGCPTLRPTHRSAGPA